MLLCVIACPSTNFVREQPLDSSIRWRQIRFLMLNAIIVGVRFVILALGGHKQVVLQNAALRQQLAVCMANAILYAFVEFSPS